MLPSPPLTDPDERISRIRFFARQIRSGDGVQVYDQGWRQGVPSEHGSEAGPRQIAVATTSSKPFPPDPDELVVVPSDPPAVAGNAVVGAVPLDHPRQMRVLLTERAVQISPTPLGHRGQRGHTGLSP